MSKNKKNNPTQSEIDGVHYHRAKNWELITSQLYSGANMAFYVLMTYATYIGNAGYGILVAVTGLIMTFSKAFDGVTDPIVAYVVERMHTGFGKVRLCLMLGWLIESIAVLAMCCWGSGHLSGTSGMVFFIVTYLIYIVGYTIHGIGGAMAGPIITNDPKQRPMVSVWSTIYAYLFPTIFSVVMASVILPRFNNEYSVPMLSASAIIFVIVAGIADLISCLGLRNYDKEEVFAGLHTGNSQANDGIKFKDMVNLLKDNKELQRYIVAAASDKLTQSIGGQAVVSTMLFGIMIGNMGAGTILSALAMLPGIVFAIFGARYAGKHGNKKAMVDWTWACIAVNVVLIAFLLVVNPRTITVNMIPTIIFFVLMLGANATKMVVSSATTSMRADIIDYELDRSGKYLSASVSATYSFIDKLVTALSTTITTALIGLIGYTTIAPQPTDPMTTGVVIMTLVLYFGFPILGWVCTLFAMRGFKLDKAEMVRVQKSIEDKKHMENPSEPETEEYLCPNLVTEPMPD